MPLATDKIYNLGTLAILYLDKLLLLEWNVNTESSTLLPTIFLKKEKSVSKRRRKKKNQKARKACIGLPDRNTEQVKFKLGTS